MTRFGADALGAAAHRHGRAARADSRAHGHMLRERSGRSADRADGAAGDRARFPIVPGSATTCSSTTRRRPRRGARSWMRCRSRRPTSGARSIRFGRSSATSCRRWSRRTGCHPDLERAMRDRRRAADHCDGAGGGRAGSTACRSRSTAATAARQRSRRPAPAATAQRSMRALPPALREKYFSADWRRLRAGCPSSRGESRHGVW